MQKVIATFVASLLLFPAGSFGQDIKVNNAWTIGQEPFIGSMGTLRESAIRQARLAAVTDATLQASGSGSWRNRHPLGFGALMGLLGGTAAGFLYQGACDENGGDLPCWVYTAPLGALLGTIVGTVTAAIVETIRQP